MRPARLKKVVLFETTIKSSSLWIAAILEFNSGCYLKLMEPHAVFREFVEGSTDWIKTEPYVSCSIIKEEPEYDCLEFVNCGRPEKDLSDHTQEPVYDPLGDPQVKIEDETELKTKDISQHQRFVFVGPSSTDPFCQTTPQDSCVSETPLEKDRLIYPLCQEGQRGWNDATEGDGKVGTTTDSRQFLDSYSFHVVARTEDKNEKKDLFTRYVPTPGECISFNYSGFRCKSKNKLISKLAAHARETKYSGSISSLSKVFNHREKTKCSRPESNVETLYTNSMNMHTAIVLGDEHLKNSAYSLETINFIDTLQCNKATLDGDKMNLIKCPKCIFQTSIPTLLEKHVRIIHKSFTKLTHSCDKCNYHTISQWALKRHLKSLHAVEPQRKYCRNECSNKTEEPQALAQKYQKKYCCDKCSHSTDDPKALKKHLSLFHEEKTEGQYYCCNKCSFDTENPLALKPHYKFWHANNPEIPKSTYFCHICSYITKNPQSLKHHLNAGHSQDHKKKYCCDKCSYNAEDKITLEHHFKFTHSLDFQKKFCCDKCSYNTEDKIALEHHFKFWHSQDSQKKYFCDKCCFDSENLQAFKRHYKLWHSQKPKKKYFCDGCSYDTEDPQALGKHFMFWDTQKPK